MVRLIDAIAMPDYLIGSPLGRKEGDVYREYFAEIEKQPGVYEKAKWVGRMKGIIKEFTPKL